MINPMTPDNASQDHLSQPAPMGRSVWKTTKCEHANRTKANRRRVLLTMAGPTRAVACVKKSDVIAQRSDVISAAAPPPVMVDQTSISFPASRTLSL